MVHVFHCGSRDLSSRFALVAVAKCLSKGREKSGVTMVHHWTNNSAIEEKGGTRRSSIVVHFQSYGRIHFLPECPSFLLDKKPQDSFSEAKKQLCSAVWTGIS